MKKVLLLIFIWPITLFAQEELTLSDAIQVGLKQNFDIQLAQKNTQINQIQNTWGQAGRYPKVDINIVQGNNLSDQSNNPTSFIQALLISNSLQGSANLNWVLFNGFAVKANKQKLEQLVAQSEGNEAVIVENTIQGIILGYYNAKLQREKMALLKNVLILSRDKYNYEKTKEELGIKTSIDMLQYESAYLTDSSNVIMQELAYKNAVRNLNLIMGVDVNQQWVLTDKLITETPMYDYEALKSKMLDNNINIKNQIVNLELLKQDITLAKTSMYPVISFNSGASYSANRYKINDFPTPGTASTSNGANLNYFANFTLNFKIFDGGKVKRAIQAVQIQEDITNLNMEKLKQQLTQELANHYDVYNTRLTIFEINKKAYEVARANFDAAKLKENSGLINSFNLRDIEMAYLRAGTNLFDSMFNLMDSKTNLIRLTGGIVDQKE